MLRKQEPNLNDTSFERVPPHNLEAEQSLLGSMMLSASAISVAIEIVTPDDFYRDAHRLIYEAISKMYLDGEPVDPVTISEALKKMSALEKIGGKPYIHNLANFVPTAANAKYYADIVARNSTLRGLIRAATDIATIAYEAPEDVERAVDESERLLFDVSKKRVSEKFVHIKPLLTENYEKIEKLAENKSLVTGLSTGFIELDRQTSGLHRSDLIVVAARPAMGKTSLALGMARHAAVEEKKGVAIFSLEMNRHQLAQRLMCSEARVDAQLLRTGQLEDNGWERLNRAMGRLAEAPIYIDDTPSITIMELRAKARRMIAKHQLDLIIIDYLQLMTGRAKSESRQQEISEISRALKVLGRELEVPILAVSQLSRAVETRDNKKPKLSDLRESGAIEQDADLVIFIYRDKYYNPENDESTAEVIIAKHRNGPTGTVRLTFLDSYAKFENLANSAALKGI